MTPELHGVVLLARDDPTNDRGGSGASSLSQYIAAGQTPDARSERLVEVRAALGNDDDGKNAFVSVLSAGQSPALRLSGADVGGRLHDAFATAVETGAITPSDVRDIVDRQATRGRQPAEDERSGKPHDGLSDYFARTSSYFDHLGTGARSEDVREAFTSESLTRANALREMQPALSAQLYAQGANAMSDMPRDRMQHQLTELSAQAPDGIGRFAMGAAAGEAERAAPKHFPGQTIEYRADGLGRVMSAVNAEIAESQRSQPPNPGAETAGAQLFTGTAAYLTAARGTELDRALGEHDARTGLRDAMNGALHVNAPTILRQNMKPDGEGLVHPCGGFDTFSSYARFEFGAPNDAHGNKTAADAQHIIGQTIGTLQGDLLKAARDGGSDLRRDFGRGTFGDPRHEQQNAALVTGQLVGAMQNGINQDFDARADRNENDQKSIKDGLDRASKLVSAIANIAGEKAGPVAEGVATVLSSLNEATPRSITSESGRGVAFGNLEQSLESSLAKHRSNSDLSNRQADGYNSAGAEWSRYSVDRDHAKRNETARESQEAMLSRSMLGTIVPTTDSVAAPLQSDPLTPDAAGRATLREVQQYNVGHARAPLPEPRAVDAWDGKRHSGTVVQIAPNEFAMHVGQGRYQVFDLDQTNGVAPVLGMPATLDRDGSIHQNVQGPTAVAR